MLIKVVSPWNRERNGSYGSVSFFVFERIHVRKEKIQNEIK